MTYLFCSFLCPKQGIKGHGLWFISYSFKIWHQVDTYENQCQMARKTFVVFLDKIDILIMSETWWNWIWNSFCDKYTCLFGSKSTEIPRIHSKSQQRTDQRVDLSTLKFLVLKKLFFPPWNTSKKSFDFFYVYSMQQYFQEINKLFFCPWKHKKNRPQKLLIIGPKLFFQVLGWLPKRAQNWFFIS